MNSQAFTPEEVKKGLLNEFVTMLLTISSLVKTSLSAFVAQTAFVITKNVNNNTNILLNFFILILLL